MIINQEWIFLNPMFLLLCVLCEMVGVKHNYYNYWYLGETHERETETLSLPTTYFLAVSVSYLSQLAYYLSQLATCMKY